MATVTQSFNRISAMLEVGLDEPAKAFSRKVLNSVASPKAGIASLRLRADLPRKELSKVAYRAPSINIRGPGGDVVSHAAPNGRFFTVGDLLKAVEDTERRTRGKAEWFGGVDVHHVFFEGLHEDADGVWVAHWGS